MYKKLSVFLLFFSIFSILAFNAAADVRKENIELFLVIDKSKSMVEEISDVSSYINDVFINDFLIPGDRLVLIQFYGKADLVFDGILTARNRDTVMGDISSIPADGRFTDIGNALDRLDQAVNEGSRRHERKYLILLTDGKQEAPPESPYYTPDGSFNHEFLKNTKTIQRAGWKIMIIGIGKDTAVKELAEELATTYELLDFSETKPASKSSSELIGRIISSGFSIENDTAFVSLRSEGYTEARNIIIEQITYQLPGGNYELLDEPVSINVLPDSEQSFKIGFSADKIGKINNNSSPGSIIFNFSGDTPFLPAVFDSIILSSSSTGNIGKDTEKVAEKSENSRNNNFNWLIIVIVILVVAAVTAFFIIRNLILHRDDDETGKRKNNEISDDS